MFLSVKLSLQPLFGLGAQECSIKKYQYLYQYAVVKLQTGCILSQELMNNLFLDCVGLRTQQNCKNMGLDYPQMGGEIKKYNTHASEKRTAGVSTLLSRTTHRAINLTSTESMVNQKQTTHLTLLQYLSNKTWLRGLTGKVWHVVELALIRPGSSRTMGNCERTFPFSKLVFPFSPEKCTWEATRIFLK